MREELRTVHKAATASHRKQCSGILEVAFWNSKGISFPNL
uniref:Uncharacterized protein n=1 Tax=Anguilla anguilla TaxID=7936 RepID=A0A0E9U6Y2_ANGAN